MTADPFEQRRASVTRRYLLTAGAATLLTWWTLPRSARAQAPTPPPASPPVPSVEGIVEALTPRRRRGAPGDPAAVDKIEQLKTVRRTRGLSHREQDELQKAATDMPQLDLEVFFDFASAAIAPASLSMLDNLGKALATEALKGGTIVIAGHTDAKGTAPYNQGLSDRRANAVAQYLTQQHKIDPVRLVATGYGFRNLKVPAQPLAPQNRRVQIINAAR